MSDIYAFQSAAIEFVDNTSWIEAIFPFGKSDLVDEH